MFKYLHLSLTLLLGFVSTGVSAQSPQPSKDGYFRIVNANNRADGKQYVYVTGAYAASRMPLRQKQRRYLVR